MKQSHKQTQNNQAYRNLYQIQKITQYHQDPELLCYFPHQRTQDQDDLYQFEIIQPQNNCHQELKQIQNKNNIQLTMILFTQNDQILKKIKEIKKYIDQQQLKSKIFKNKINQNHKTINYLKQKKQKLLSQTEKLKTLNQSSIPSKSLQLNSTLNTNTWMNQLFNKSELQNLWSTKNNKTQKNTQTKLKNYTIDLSSFMSSAKLNMQKSKEKQKYKLSNSKIIDRTKLKNNSKILQNKTHLKVQITQKQKILNKNLSQLRNLKKNKFNPQI